MEILFFLQPLGEWVSFVGGVACALLVVIFSTAGIMILSEGDWSETTTKNAKRVAWIIAGILLVSSAASIPANAWDIYKNILVYRAVQSNTTAKGVDAINASVDKLKEFVDKVDIDKLVEGIEE